MKGKVSGGKYWRTMEEVHFTLSGNILNYFEQLNGIILKCFQQSVSDFKGMIVIFHHRYSGFMGKDCRGKEELGTEL